MFRVVASIRVKAFAFVFGLTFLLVGCLTTYFETAQVQSLQGALERKAVSYARLVAKQVEPGVAFDDRETVREVFEAAVADSDVAALALYKASGRSLHVLGELEGGAPPPFRPDGGVFLQDGRSYLRASVPVVSREGPAGTLVLELTTAGVAVERVRLQRAAAIVALGALVVGLAGAWLIGRSLARRISFIASATRAVAAGDLSVKPLEDVSRDELGQLARDFNKMFANLRSLVEQIQRAGDEEKERLDALVRERTAELDARNADLRLVLDHVGQGLFMVNRSGVIGRERSRMVDSLLVPPARDATLWDLFGAVEPKMGAWMRVCWDAVVEDTLPLDVALAQMPESFRRGDRHMRIEYRPIVADGMLSRVLVVVSDVTSDVVRQRIDAEQRDLVTVFARATEDRSAVAEFLHEAGALVRLIVDTTERTPHLDRAIHTLKGNAAIFGLTSLSAYLHDVEQTMRERGSPPDDTERADLRARWLGLTGKLAALVDEGGAGKIEVEPADCEQLIERIVSGAPREQLAHDVWRLRLEPTSRRLRRLARQAQAIAERLEKRVDVAIEPNAVRLDSSVWAPFWSAFVHVLRNAIDHGIESEEERAARGKAAVGTLRIRTYVRDGEFVVEATDDGRGIDWGALAERAEALGLAHGTHRDLTEILFRDGVSTRAEITETSGRGVGLGAVRDACAVLGGSIEVDSSTGAGTTFRFRFAASATGDRSPVARARPSVAPAA